MAAAKKVRFGLKVNSYSKFNFTIFLIFYFLFSLSGCKPGKTDGKTAETPAVFKKISIFKKTDNNVQSQIKDLEISLEGIIYDSKNPLAIVNNEIVSQGSLIGQKKVVKINSQSVEFKDSHTGKSFVLELAAVTESLNDRLKGQSEDSDMDDLKSDLQIKATVIDTPKLIVYFPSKIYFNKKYPLLVVFSPSGDYKNSLKFFRPLSEKHKLVILVSKEFRNGIDMNPIIQDLASFLLEVSKTYPVDKERVIVSGFSGGAMGAHFFAYSHPEIVSAIMINTGMIHESLRGKSSDYPKRKMAVFLASQTDGRFSQMKEDKRFLDKLNWETKWIEFKGGHRVAPISIYEQAFQWIKLKNSSKSRIKQKTNN